MALFRPAAAVSEGEKGEEEEEESEKEEGKEEEAKKWRSSPALK